MGLKQKERSGWWRKLFQKIDAELSVFQWQSIMANFRGPMETSGEARYPQEWNNVSFAIERFHIVKIRFKSKIEITFYLKSIHLFQNWMTWAICTTHTHTHTPMYWWKCRILLFCANQSPYWKRRIVWNIVDAYISHQGYTSLILYKCRMLWLWRFLKCWYTLSILLYVGYCCIARTHCGCYPVSFGAPH